MARTRKVHGYDYQLQQPVSLTRAALRRRVSELIATGGRTVRHKREKPGDDDLLLMRRGEIIAEFYDRD